MSFTTDQQIDEAASGAGYPREAAEYAVSLVESGMVVGLGTGTTATFAVECLAERLEAGALEHIVVVATSSPTEALARELGIPMTTLEAHPSVDLTLDGADEVDPRFDVIKGGGGALLREKIVAQASLREVIIVEETKLSPALGTHRPVPVEVLPFGWRSQVGFLESLGARVRLRLGHGQRLVETEQGNLILDCELGPIPRPAELARRLSDRAGIIEHGLFLGLVTELVVAGPSGVRLVKRR